MKALASLAVAIALLASVAHGDELLSYQASGWKYLEVPWDDPIGQEFYEPTFVDTAFSLGTGAFGTLGSTHCPILVTVQTNWNINTDLLLLRDFSALASEPCTLFWSVDNDAIVYINGTTVADVTHSGCAELDDFTIVAPPTALVDGTNTLAVRAHDYGSVTYFDMRIHGTVAPVSVEGGSWGRIKAMYR
jgi:hypothetical protein